MAECEEQAAQRDRITCDKFKPASGVSMGVAAQTFPNLAVERRSRSELVLDFFVALTGDVDGRLGPHELQRFVACAGPAGRTRSRTCASSLPCGVSRSIHGEQDYEVWADEYVKMLAAAGHADVIRWGGVDLMQFAALLNGPPVARRRRTDREVQEMLAMLSAGHVGNEHDPPAAAQSTLAISMPISSVRDPSATVSAGGTGKVCKSSSSKASTSTRASFMQSPSINSRSLASSVRGGLRGASSRDSSPSVHHRDEDFAVRSPSPASVTRVMTPAATYVASKQSVVLSKDRPERGVDMMGSAVSAVKRVEHMKDSSPAWAFTSDSGAARFCRPIDSRTSPSSCSASLMASTTRSGIAGMSGVQLTRGQGVEHMKDSSPAWASTSDIGAARFSRPVDSRTSPSSCSTPVMDSTTRSGIAGMPGVQPTRGQGVEHMRDSSPAVASTSDIGAARFSRPIDSRTSPSSCSTSLMVSTTQSGTAGMSGVQLPRGQDADSVAGGATSTGLPAFTSAEGLQVARADLVRAVFHACDADSDGWLNACEMLKFAQHTGFSKDEARWHEKYRVLCLENEADPRRGIDPELLERIVNDPSERGLFCSKTRLRSALAALTVEAKQRCTTSQGGGVLREKVLVKERLEERVLSRSHLEEQRAASHCAKGCEDSSSAPRIPFDADACLEALQTSMRSAYVKAGEPSVTPRRSLVMPCQVDSDHAWSEREASRRNSATAAVSTALSAERLQRPRTAPQATESSRRSDLELSSRPWLGDTAACSQAAPAPSRSQATRRGSECSEVSERSAPAPGVSSRLDFAAERTAPANLAASAERALRSVVQSEIVARLTPRGGLSPRGADASYANDGLRTSASSSNGHVRRDCGVVPEVSASLAQSTASVDHAVYSSSASQAVEQHYFGVHANPLLALPPSGDADVGMRARLVNAVFRHCDVDGDGHLNIQEMLRFAISTGFGGNDEEWREEFALLCDEAGCDPRVGVSATAFTRLVQTGGGCFCSDAELVDLCENLAPNVAANGSLCR